MTRMSICLCLPGGLGPMALVFTPAMSALAMAELRRWRVGKSSREQAWHQVHEIGLDDG